MPKAKTDREGNSPYTRNDEDANTRRKKKCTNEEARPIDDVRQQKNIDYEPGSTENMLKCFIKHHKTSLESTKKETAEIVEKMNQTKLAYAELNQENDHLKKRLSDVEKTKQELENKSKALNEENELLMQKCSAAKDLYASLETGYDTQLTALNAVISNLQSILSANNSEKSKLQSQLAEKDMECQQKLAQLETSIDVKQTAIFQLQGKITELQLEATEKDANVEREKQQTHQRFLALLQLKEDELLQLEELKILTDQQHIDENLKFEKTIKQLESSLRTQEDHLAEMELKNTQLELRNNELSAAFDLEKVEIAKKFEQVAQLNEALSKLQDELQQKIAAYAQAVEENAQRRDTIFQLETLLQDKDNQLLEMQLKQREMENAFEDEKLLGAEQSKNIAELLEELSQLQDVLQQKTTAFGQQIEEIGQHEAEMQLITKKWEESEKNSSDLKQQIEKLSKEAQTATEQSEIKMMSTQINLDRMHTTITEMETRENKYQADIKELKETNGQLKNNLEQEIQARQEYETLMIEKDKQLTEMQQNHLNITNKLTSENAKLSQQLATFTELQEKKLMELQEMLQQKEADIAGSKQDYTDLERQKNATIAELKYKMTQIGNVFSQPMGRATPLKKALNNQPIRPLVETITRPVSVASVGAVDNFNNSIVKMAATLPETSRTIRRRQQLKRPANQTDWSDFNSDTDGAEDNWKPKPKKSPKISKSQQIRLVEPQTANDAFDQLKQT